MSELMACRLLLPGMVYVISLNIWGWTRMVKATFLTPAGFIGHTPLSKVSSNALICMGAYVADGWVTVTSTAKHNDLGQLMNSLVQWLAAAWLTNCLLAMI